MGGATLGHALAARGERVLFCERGRNPVAGRGTLSADYPEQWAEPRGAVLDERSADLLASAGRCRDTVTDESGQRPLRFVPFIGAGSGGSSALYGMALERFAAADFAPRANHPNVTQSTLDEAWPIAYDDFCTHYAAAETLYRVRGSGDPLAQSGNPPRYSVAPPPPTAAASELFGFFAAKGLHPYRLPQACEFVDGCQGCQGFLCDRDCKNDSSRICLRPAIRDFGATLLDECQVLRIDASRSRATGVTCRWRGNDITLRGKRIFLAAGALQTPNLLLRSRSADWPDGLANRSGLVGRNLMRHCIDLYLVEPDRAALGGEFDNRFKEFAFNDFYRSNGVKLGSVQSFGRLPPAPMLFGSLRQDLRDGPVPLLAAAVSLARPLLQPMLQRWVDRSITLATIMEDLPYHDNRVVPKFDADAGAVRMSYRLRDPDRRRTDSGL